MRRFRERDRKFLEWFIFFVFFPLALSLPPSLHLFVGLRPLHLLRFPPLPHLPTRSTRSVGLPVHPTHVALPHSLARSQVVLFGAMRGLTIAADPELVTKCLSSVELVGKANELVRTFSGGQKRRLSVALSLLGNPSVVVLDEPTTGMDVITRQSVWKSIQALKGKATIIMTTHAMEEADALGDRIAVLSRGKVQAQGTALDLKNTYGVGFHLHVVTKKASGQATATQAAAKGSSDALVNVTVTTEVDFDDDGGAAEAKSDKSESAAPAAATSSLLDPTPIMDTLRAHVDARDDVQLLTNVGAECSMTLPNETSKFPKLFDELESRRSELGIEQLALSMTTLEEVFLQLGKLEEAKDREEEGDDECGDDKCGDDDANIKVDVKTASAATSKQDRTGGVRGSWSQQVKGTSLLSLYTKKKNPTTAGECLWKEVWGGWGLWGFWWVL